MLQSAFYKTAYTVLFFLANLLLANILLPANFGTITLMMVNAAIIYLITGFGTDSILLHLVTNKKWSLPQAVSFTQYTFILQGLLFLILEVLHFKLWGSALLIKKEAGFLFFEVLYFAGLILTEKYFVLFNAIHKASRANWLLLFCAALYMAAIVIAKTYHLTSFKLLFSIFCLQSLLQGCLLLVVFHWSEKFNFFIKVPWPGLYGVLKMSFVVVVTNFIQFFAYRIDFLLLKNFYTNYEVGVYAQVNKFANLMWIIPKIFAVLLMPKFSQISTEKIPHIFRYAILSGLGLLLATLIVTKFFYSYFINSEYQNGLSAFYLILPGYFSWSVVIYFGAYFSWLGKFYNNLIISSFCFITILVSDLILIPKLSINGAAISNTIAYSATLVVCFFLFSKTTGMGILKILRTDKNESSILSTLLK
jgi:O-antigen/teichoic acid export membrane protein